MPDQAQQIATGLDRLALFWRAGRWRESAALGLTPTQAEILARVAARPERGSSLAAALGISAPSLSDSISALVARGLADRRADSRDRRARLIAATPAGGTLAARLSEAPEPLPAQIAALPEAEAGALLRALTRIIRGLQEARAIPVQRMCVTCRHFRPFAHDDAARPHHCAFVDAAFADAALRLDCADHEQAPPDERTHAWARFTDAG